ncbi:hypothetical protein EDD85DRAFT_930930 [Armillaria nabsnona]|nr:hypothetical protein EDD85DRAFT_930930 [Armillaria nabsnona]
MNHIYQEKQNHRGPKVPIPPGGTVAQRAQYSFAWYLRHAWTFTSAAVPLKLRLRQAAMRCASHVIFHLTFNQFLEKIYPAFEPDDTAISSVRQIHDYCAYHKYRRSQRSIRGAAHLGQRSIFRRHGFKTIRECVIALVVKRALGEGGCDASYSVLSMQNHSTIHRPAITDIMCFGEATTQRSPRLLFCGLLNGVEMSQVRVAILYAVRDRFWPVSLHELHEGIEFAYLLFHIGDVVHNGGSGDSVNPESGSQALIHLGDIDRRGVMGYSGESALETDTLVDFRRR